jgi:hypothetical protein
LNSANPDWFRDWARPPGETLRHSSWKIPNRQQTIGNGANKEIANDAMKSKSPCSSTTRSNPIASTASMNGSRSNGAAAAIPVAYALQATRTKGDEDELNPICVSHVETLGGFRLRNEGDVLNHRAAMRR